MKMKTNQVMDVCKVSIVKIEDFDEAILVVQVQVNKFEVKNMWLDGGSGVNIILESLRKKHVKHEAIGEDHETITSEECKVTSGECKLVASKEREIIAW